MAELPPATKEVANLRRKEADAHRHADKAEQSFADLIEKSRKDNVEAERVWKERDELLQTMVGLRAGRDSTRQERDDCR